MDQKPSVGRIVHFNWNGRRQAAIVTEVVSDTCVHLAVFTEAGVVNEASVSYEMEVSVNPTRMFTSHRTWAWPPRV